MLGPLGDNGGPTLTHLPLPVRPWSTTSPPGPTAAAPNPTNEASPDPSAPTATSDRSNTTHHHRGRHRRRRPRRHTRRRRLRPTASAGDCTLACRDRRDQRRSRPPTTIHLAAGVDLHPRAPSAPNEDANATGDLDLTAAPHGITGQRRHHRRRTASTAPSTPTR
ncbi:MAG: hypothetical protein U5R31_09885 [Acidimicrobiia bacterium]|nr:hypothetical protein [Acidimicrobiia bacterium]